MNRDSEGLMDHNRMVYEEIISSDNLWYAGLFYHRSFDLRNPDDMVLLVFYYNEHGGRRKADSERNQAG